VLFELHLDLENGDGMVTYTADVVYYYLRNEDPSTNWTSFQSQQLGISMAISIPISIAISRH
jgi:hypothetical protein